MISKITGICLIALICFSVGFSKELKKPYRLKIKNPKHNVYANRVQAWTDDVYAQLKNDIPQFNLKTNKLKINYYYISKKLPKMLSIDGELFIHSSSTNKKNTVVIQKNPLGSDYAEFHFKNSVTKIFLQNAGYKSPWLISGLSIDLNSKNMEDSFCKRNYLYLALRYTDKNKNPSIKTILSTTKKPKKSKDRLIFDSHSWLLFSYLKKTNHALLKQIISNQSDDIEELPDLNLLNDDYLQHIRETSIGLMPSENASFSSRKDISKDDTALFIQNISQASATQRKKKISQWIKNNRVTANNIKPFLHDKPVTVIGVALEIASQLNSRSLLPTAISLAISHKNKKVQKAASQTVKELNMGYFPFRLTKYLHHKNIDVSESTANLMYELADKTIALAALGNLNGNSGRVDGYVAFTTSRNYISDYDVVDGVLKPVVSTFHEGVVLGVKILWVTRVQTRMVSALNHMGLGMQFQTANQWTNWNNTH